MCGKSLAEPSEFRASNRDVETRIQVNIGFTKDVYAGQYRREGISHPLTS
jgi:hypothetical protein